jgi:hypothetical protein
METQERRQEADQIAGIHYVQIKELPSYWHCTQVQK